jgi:hypothetical protein
MRARYSPILYLVFFCCPLAAQPGAKVPETVKAGETAKSTDAGAVTATASEAEGKGPQAAKAPASPVAPAAAPGTSEATADKPPVIESVFPTTTYPVQDRFAFEINGQNFDPDPDQDQIEVEGQGRVPFVTRFKSQLPSAVGANQAEPEECMKRYPCLGVGTDGRRLLVYGFPRRYAYQGPLKVRVSVKKKDGTDAFSDYSALFTLSRVDHRIIVWLTFVLFGLLMYIVYRLVVRGVQGYMIAGRKYSPLAAFLIDKSTDSFSLSKFQLFAFSMVSFFGYVYVLLCRTLVQWNFTFPEIPDNYPSLLAISAGTTAAAAGLNSNRITKGGGPVYPSAADFISTGGLVVAERFQFFVWTLIACLGFVALILMQDPAKVVGFPTFPSGLLYVMGVSAAGYLGGKAVRNPGPILKKVDVKANAGVPTDLDVTLTGEYLDPKATFRIDNALQKTTGPVTGPQQPQAPPGYSTELKFTLSQAAGFAKWDHVFEISNADGLAAQANFTATPMQVTTPPGPTPHGATAEVSFDVKYYRPECTARWLAPGASEPVDIAAADVSAAPAAAPAAPDVSTVKVKVPVGDKPGIGTLTLVSPKGGTEATSVTIT